MERILVGIPASPGIVVGPAHVLLWEVPPVRLRLVPPEQVDAEIAHFHDALAKARDRVAHLRTRVEQHVGTEEARIFEAQALILQDAEIIQKVELLVRHDHFAAESAFDLTMNQWRSEFARSPSPMIRERVGDLVDVHIRVLSLLLGLPDHDPGDVPKGGNAILVTHDLTPSLTVQLDREAIAAVATDAGTRISHVAILARSLGLPAVVGLRDATQRIKVGDRLILDGGAGVLAINPTDQGVAQYQERQRQLAEMEAQDALMAGEEAVTQDQVQLLLRANVDLPEDAPFAAQSGADGVGLMRTEFLIVGRATMPDEEEQYRAYRKVVEAFHGHAVIIRTYDIGGDKLPVGGYPSEPNPFLGWRAIRMCLDEPALFRAQLRALLRAAQHGDVRIMLPLVITLDEVMRARELLEESARELAARGVPHRGSVPLGVMVETPAAAIAADTLAPHVDFFSIGTNDLTQYTLAIDRGNANLASRFTPLHPAVLRLIRRIADVGIEHGLDVGVCGEMASQPLMAYALIGLGIRQLSVAPRSVARMKRVVRRITVRAATEAANEAMDAGTAASAEAILRHRLLGELGDATELLDGLPVPEASSSIQG
ncbi:MAG TPA: phosphoenolpyruvate--protein phosphotransferase [Gemmatimonadaceae bacterium]|nr:phosphoenolpyruvate--protein phosphotransferase [Gemmatimonadaceae bacterium]